MVKFGRWTIVISVFATFVTLCMYRSNIRHPSVAVHLTFGAPAITGGQVTMPCEVKASPNARVYAWIGEMPTDDTIPGWVLPQIETIQGNVSRSLLDSFLGRNTWTIQSANLSWFSHSELADVKLDIRQGRQFVLDDKGTIVVGSCTRTGRKMYLLVSAKHFTESDRVHEQDQFHLQFGDLLKGEEPFSSIDRQ